MKNFRFFCPARAERQDVLLESLRDLFKNTKGFEPKHSCLSYSKHIATGRLYLLKVHIKPCDRAEMNACANFGKASKRYYLSVQNTV